MKFLLKNKWLAIVLVLVLSVIIYYAFPATPEYPSANIMAALVFVMAFFWLIELIPIPITSMFPLLFFPLLGIDTLKNTATFYGKPIIFLFLGGLILAQALQKTNLHKRIALNILNLIGTKFSGLLLGFMVATAFLSMWIANTASVMVMMPIGLSIISTIKEVNSNSKLMQRFTIAILLSIAYAADIGGMATLIGTPPNMVFVELQAQLFPELTPTGFSEWFIMGIPISITFLLLGWLTLKWLFKIPAVKAIEDKNIIKDELEKIKTITLNEKIAGFIFALTALLWMFGNDITLSEHFTIKGWRSLLNLKEVTDPSVAVGAAILLFIIPGKHSKPVLAWEDVQTLPWGMLLLFGGGFALAGGFETTGLSNLLGNVIGNLSFSHPLVAIMVVCVLLTFLTEFTTNTATTTLILPILAKASVLLGIDPRALMIPATLSASCAFMTPIASPTQTIIFGTGEVSIKQMMRAGIFFNIIGVFIVSVVFYFLSGWVFGIVY